MQLALSEMQMFLVERANNTCIEKAPMAMHVNGFFVAKETIVLFCLCLVGHCLIAFPQIPSAISIRAAVSVSIARQRIVYLHINIQAKTLYSKWKKSSTKSKLIELMLLSITLI